MLAVINLGVGLVERGFVDDPRERRAFTEQYQAPIYAVAGISWLMLSVFGILPGTGRFKRNPMENEVKASQLVASAYQNHRR